MSENKTKKNKKPDKAVNIRRFVKEDIIHLHQLLSSGRVMQHLEDPFSLEKTEDFLERYGLSIEPTVFAVECDAVFAGYIIWNPYDSNSYEIGWILP